MGDAAALDAVPSETTDLPVEAVEAPEGDEATEASENDGPRR